MDLYETRMMGGSMSEGKTQILKLIRQTKHSKFPTIQKIRMDRACVAGEAGFDQ